MTKEELRGRLNALGYITQTAAAEALHEKQYNIHRYLTGKRPIPDRLDRELARLEADPAPVLTSGMAYALTQAKKVGGRVTAPSMTDIPLSMRAVDWTATMEALRVMGLVKAGKLTERGAKALARYRKEQG